MIDSHCHLNLAPLGSNLTEVLRKAKQNGVKRIMVPGITPASWKVLSSFNSQPYCDILPIDTAIGLHPYFLPKERDEIPPLLKQFEEAVAGAVVNTKESLSVAEGALPNSQGFLAVAQGCDPEAQGCLSNAQGCLSSAKGCFCAIGETGLDGHIPVDMNVQKQVLHAHLDIADSFGLPVILHHRKSHHLLFEALKASSFEGRGVIHAFSGSTDVAKRYIDRGFCLGIGGTITYERAKKTKDTVTYLLRNHPESILLETDAPDMPMSGRQGQPNMPHYLTDVVAALSGLSEIEPNEIKTITSANYARLFKPSLF
ncbi:TatD family deoxyribonuclease [Alteromonas genovensis]|uniref:TatD family deoxyribonuclease n=1 Tax=Alteromonas genovensis TaxID=471225 RepID=A0A6N9TAU9_9ALTE|nr:TatD family hydrolase [Alteromonas genovensis]NDW14427.1 TatD family deoxyribonuclease [Alteromonas genovensis]